MKRLLHHVPLALGVAALGFAAHPASASATVYSFQADDLGTAYTGAGAANSANFIQTPSTDTTTTVGTTTYDDYSVTDAGVTFSYQATGNYGYTGSGASATVSTLLSEFDLIAGTNIDGEMSLTGLAPDTDFTAYFYSVNGEWAPQGRMTTFDLSAANGGNSGTSTETQDTTFDNPGNYVTVTGMTDSSGDINLTYFSPNGEADFSGAQFVVGASASAAPEPSQIGMLILIACGLGTLLVTARKRSASF